MDEFQNIPENESINSEDTAKTADNIDESAPNSQDTQSTAEVIQENEHQNDVSYEAYLNAQENLHQAPPPPYSPNNSYSPYNYERPQSYSPYRDANQFYGSTFDTGVKTGDPKTAKGNKIGKTIFIIAICICLISASMAIGYSLRNFSEPSPFVSTDEGSNNAPRTGDANGPAVTISPTPIEEKPPTGTLTASDIYKKVKSINVGVLVYSNNNLAGEGSGVIMGEDKTGKYTYIITCAHVISDYGTNVRIRFDDNTDIDAVVIGYDKKTDIGVLRVEKKGLNKAEFGDIKSVAVGQSIYAIGNPGGTEFFGSFTKGMISAVDRPVDSAVGYSQPCIQHTAAINPGNSGGALLNEYGQVIGINSSKIAETYYEGMGFAVPINTVKTVVDEIIKHGYVTNRPKLGISYSPITQSQIYSIIVQSNGLPSGSIIIREIDSESDLQNKGVQVNDLIIKANGKDLTSTNTLPEIIDNMKVGDTITLTICRINSNYTINKPFDVKVKLIEDKGYNEAQNVPKTTDPIFNPFG